MPVRALRPCREAGCYELTRSRRGYCEKHDRSWSHERTAKQRGYGARWSKLRKFVLHRDRYECQPCLRSGRLNRATQVDHVVPKAQGGSDEPTNLQAICATCHAAKSSAEGRAAQRRRAKR